MNLFLKGLEKLVGFFTRPSFLMEKIAFRFYFGGILRLRKVRRDHLAFSQAHQDNYWHTCQICTENHLSGRIFERKNLYS